MCDITATYSPEDNKLRLYASSRLDADTYAKVKAAGFKWAPKQDLFVAPMWTPGREDLCLELAGDILPEQTSLAERAEERAERFAQYREKRLADAQRQQQANEHLGKRFSMGQPILVGHHSERSARRDQERLHNGTQREIDLWKTASYWRGRAEGARGHAEYKELPAVRARRIKTLEAEKRGRERDRDTAQKYLKLWSKENLSHDDAKAIANYDHISTTFPLDKYPRAEGASTYEGSMSLWSALDGIIDAAKAAAIATRAHHRTIAYSNRWIEHIDLRLVYERAMLDETGGLEGAAFAYQIGGQVFDGRDWSTIRRVNTKNGAITSLTTDRKYVGLISIEKVRDYSAPSAEQAEAAKLLAKAPPICNYRSPGCVEMTKAEFERKHKDYRRYAVIKASETHEAHRLAEIMASGCKLVPVFFTDKKEVPAPPPRQGGDIRQSALDTLRAAHLPSPPRTSRPELARDPEDQALAALKDQKPVEVIIIPGLFNTPPTILDAIKDLIAEHAQKPAIGPLRILEPSAGAGAILGALDDPSGHDLVLIDHNAQATTHLGQRYPEARVLCRDFLSVQPSELGVFDLILMNPPFDGAADIRHIDHARRFLAPRGLLIAVCAAGPRQSARFKDDAIGWRIFSDAFAEQGTRVHAALFALQAHDPMTDTDAQAVPRSA